MEVQDWLDQISTTFSAGLSSSLPTSPLPGQGGLKRKRIMTSASTSREPSPSKRRRTTRGSSQVSELSDRTRLPSIPSVPSRQGSPTRDIFNELRRADPPIIYETGINGDLPPNVEVLLRYLTDRFGQDILPLCLKSRIVHSDRLIDIPEPAYTALHKMTQSEAELLWEQLGTIHLDARDCDIYGRDESAWCHEVVHPLVGSALEGVKLRLISVQSQQIDASLLPVTTNTLARLNKKADYAFAFSWRDKEVSELYQKVSLGGQGYRISQTNDAFTKRIILFSGVEVKPEDGGKKEALAQLAIWLTANFQKKKSLYQLANGDVHDGAILPTPGFTVIGHDWHTFVAYSVGKEIRIVGPISTVQADTRSIYGIFKLRDLLRRAAQYASDVYWPWVRDDILQPLAKDIQPD